MNRYFGFLRIDLRARAVLTTESHGELVVDSQEIVETCIYAAGPSSGTHVVTSPAIVLGTREGERLVDVQEVVIAQHPGVELRIFDVERLPYSDSAFRVVDGRIKAPR